MDGTNADDAGSASQQQDWSAVWECFDNPHTLLSTPGGGLSKGMQVHIIIFANGFNSEAQIAWFSFLYELRAFHVEL